MVFPGTYLNVFDNSGGIKAMCIKSLGRSKRFARVGEPIVVTLKKVRPRMKIKSGTVHKAVIICGADWRKRSHSYSVKNNFWGCVIMKKNGYVVRGTRILIPVNIELYHSFMARVLLLAPSII